MILQAVHGRSVVRACGHEQRGSATVIPAGPFEGTGVHQDQAAPVGRQEDEGYAQPSLPARSSTGHE